MEDQPQPWTVEHSEYLFKRPPYFTVRKDSVVLPSGVRIEDYFVYEYPDWVIALAVTDQDEFVCIRQYRHGIGKVFYELAAGVADEGESLMTCAQRELLEETGYGGGAWKPLLQASANPGTHNNTAHVFLATGVQKIAEPDLEDTEDITVHLLNRAQMLDELKKNEVFQAIHQAAIWRYLAAGG